MTNTESSSNETKADDAVFGRTAAGSVSTSQRGDPPNVADRYADLLRAMPRAKRLGLISRISQGFYDDWRPSRHEIADLVAVELRLLTVDDCLERQRQRRLGREPAEDFIPIVLAQGR